MNINTPIAAGIDVSKKSLSVFIRYQNDTEKAFNVPNTNAGIKQILIPNLEGCNGKIVMESTGHYHWLSALSLKEAGHDVREVNPILSKQYVASTIRKVKTDPADAKGLARMALVCEELPKSFSGSKEKLEMRKKIGFISSMKHSLQSLKAALKSLEEAKGIINSSLSEAEKEIRNNIISLEKSIKNLEKEVVQETMETKKDDLEILRTITGVSLLTASIALASFETKSFKTAKSWIAFAGLDVSSRESGTWRGRCHLTKRGNAYLRSRLYSAAWGAVMHDEKAKEYYNKLKKEGRSHVEALTIISRKIVRMMFVILRDKTVYDSSKYVT